MNIYQTGNTIELTGEFKDWNNEPVNPEAVRFKVYNSHFTQISDQEVFKDPEKPTGEFSQYYVFNEPGDYVYEWFGMINNTPSLRRERIRVVNI